MPRYKNGHGLPQSIMRAVEKDLYENEYDTSVTTLIDPPRKVLLEARHDHEIVIDIVKCLARLRGNAMHALLEWGKRPEDIAEKRYGMVIDGTSVGYKPDLLEHLQALAYHLFDYKSNSIAGIKHGSKPEHIAQTNLYRFGLTEFEGLAIPYMTLVYMLWDYRNYEAKFKSSYPDAGIAPLSVTEFWTPKQSEQYLRERIALHKAAADLPDDQLPLCTEAERWASGRKWKVKKPANQQASKSCESEEEAREWRDKQKKPSDYKIIECPPEYIRCCTDYCDARPWCNQCEPLADMPEPSKPVEITWVDSAAEEF